MPVHRTDDPLGLVRLILVEVHELSNGAPHDEASCDECRTLNERLAHAEGLGEMEPGHEDRCELCAGLDGCTEARRRTAARAQLILDALSSELADAHLAKERAGSSAPDKLAALTPLLERLTAAIDHVGRWARHEEEKVHLPADSRQW